MTEHGAKFYDNRLLEQDTFVLPQGIGSQAFPLCVRAPYQFAEERLQKFATEQKGRELKALDLCCGLGVHSVMLAKLGFKVTAVDLSAQSIEIAKKFAQAQSVSESIDFFVEDAAKALDQFASDSFDVIYISGAMYYLTLAKQGERIQKILANKGLFICIETNGENALINAYRYGRYIFNKHRDEQTMSHLLTLAQLKQLGSLFRVSDVTCFDFFTLWGSCIRKFPMLMKAWHRLAISGDRFIFNRSVFKKICFKFVLISEK